MELKGNKLIIPGPVAVEDDVLSNLAKPVVAHYGQEWATFYNETVEMAKRVFQTNSELFIMVGSGHYGVEAALKSLGEPGGEIIIVETGHFGGRMTELANSHGIKTHVLDGGWGGVIKPAQVAEALKAHPSIKVVAIVQNETSTGLVNPIREVAQVCSEHDAILMVDGVSSVGGMDIQVDAWGVDVCVCATQKCLGAPPGLTLVSVSEKAFKHMKARRTTITGWAMNLLKWKEFADEGRSVQPYYITMAVNIVFALHKALELVLEEGLEPRFARHRDVAAFFRSSIRKLGLQPFGEDEYASPTVGVFRVPDGYRDQDIISFLSKKHGIQTAGGLGKLAGKTVRVGHMGPAARQEKISPLLSAIQDWLHNEGLLPREQRIKD